MLSIFTLLYRTRSFFKMLGIHSLIRLSDVFFKWNDLLVLITFSFNICWCGFKACMELLESRFLGVPWWSHLSDCGKAFGIRSLERVSSNSGERRLGEKWPSHGCMGTGHWGHMDLIPLPRDWPLPCSCWWLWSMKMGPVLPYFLIFVREGGNPNFVCNFLIWNVGI